MLSPLVDATFFLRLNFSLDAKMTLVKNKGSSRTVQMCRLVRAFAFDICLMGYFLVVQKK